MRRSLAAAPVALALAVAGSACVELAVPEENAGPCAAGEARDEAGACVPTCAAPRPWYRDRDGDGQGAGGAAGEECELPVGGSWDPFDCNDEPPAPGEAVDTRFATAAFVDADLDGFGDPGSPAVGCDPLPPGLSRNGEDCGDTEAGTHPDLCGGPCGAAAGPALAACGANGSCSACNADLVLRGVAEDHLGDVAVADFDGDGWDDLAVAGPDHLGYAGAIHVVFGPLGQGEGLLDGGPGSLTLVAPGPFAGVGYSLASPGDLDGDGAAELLVGTASWGHANDHHAGTATVVPGRVLAAARALGLPRALPLLDEEGGEVGAAALVLRESPLDQSPVILRVAGAAADLTGDGRADLVVAGEGSFDPADPGVGRVGAAFVVPAGCLPAAGAPTVEVELSAAPACTLDGAEGHGAAIYGGVQLVAGNTFVVTAQPADLDGVPPVDLLALLPGEPDSGVELIGLFGPLRDRLSSAGALTMKSSSAGHLIAAAALPDLDGDGHAELAVTDLSDSAPLIRVIYGPLSAGLFDPAARGAVRVVTRAGTPTRTFGYHLTNAGDLDGDGLPELLVSDYWAGDGGSRTGAVLIYRGASLLPGAAEEAPVRLEGPPVSGAQVGRSAPATGDLNHDGILDLVVTARMEHAELPGAVMPGAYVFYGPLGGR